MKTLTATRFGAMLVAACFALPSSGLAASTGDDILGYSVKQKDILEAEVQQGKRTGEELAKFVKSYETFSQWHQAAGWTGLQTLVPIPMAPLDTNTVYAIAGLLGDRVPADPHELDPLDRVYPVSFNSRTIFVSFGKDNPNFPEKAKYFFFIGRAVSRDTIGADSENGAFKCLTNEEYQDIAAQLSKGSTTRKSDADLFADVAKGRYDQMLLELARRLGLPTEERGPWWPYAVGGAILFVILVVLLVRLLSSGQKPPVVGAVPGAIPGGAPGAIPGGAPGAIPGGAPGAIPGGAPGAIPGGAPAINPIIPSGGSEDPGTTVVACPHCGTPMKDGKCPRGCEECPSCHSVLVGGVCPNGHTILRCPTCGDILRDGECPNGHGAKPLSLGGPDSEKMSLSPFQLEVVDAPVTHRHERCDVPESVVIGRDFREATGPYIQLRFADAAQRQSCSRTYVKLAYAPDKSAVRVTLVASNTSQFAVVDGRRLSRKGDAADLAEGAVLELNPGYRLKLVRRA